MSDAGLAAALRFILQDEPWKDYAACKGMGPELFFPRRGQSPRPGQAVCARCPVTGPCGEYQQRSGSEHGIWGGVLQSRGIGTAAPVPVPNPTFRREPMIPKSLSATSIQVFEECPKRFEVEYLHRTPSPSGSAASLGTACHEAIERWVAEGHYLMHTGSVDSQWAVMQALYDQAYWGAFSDPARYDEGKGLLRTWLGRQNWEGRTVLSTEQKKSFVIKTSVGDIPFNYIMDRKDLLDDGDVQVTDYKSLSQPLSPDKLRHKLQARCYALAAQIEHPEAKRIWVEFDMLRYEPVAVVFTKEENRATWKYLHELAERIIADTNPQEKLGNACRFCVRKLECESLTKHAAGGGVLGLTGPAEAARKRYEIAAAKNALDALIKDIDEYLVAHCQYNDVTEFDAGEFEVSLGVSGRRQADATRVATIIGPDLMARYGNLNISAVDALLKGDELTADQKSQVRQTIRKAYGDPTVRVVEKSPF